MTAIIMSFLISFSSSSFSTVVDAHAEIVGAVAQEALKGQCHY